MPSEGRRCQDGPAQPDRSGERCGQIKFGLLLCARRLADMLSSLGVDDGPAGAPPLHIDVPSPCYVFGDIHGSLVDLIFIFEKCCPFGSPRHAVADVLFLGDYVDRGDCSVEVVAFLFAWKLLCPQRVHLLRGNHEDPDVNGDVDGYGTGSFRWQCVRLCGGNEAEGRSLWEEVNATFAKLPIAATLDGRIFACHGGIPRAAVGFDKEEGRREQQGGSKDDDDDDTPTIRDLLNYGTGLLGHDDDSTTKRHGGTMMGATTVSGGEVSSSSSPSRFATTLPSSTTASGGSSSGGGSTGGGWASALSQHGGSRPIHGVDAAPANRTSSPRGVPSASAGKTGGLAVHRRGIALVSQNNGVTSASAARDDRPHRGAVTTAAADTSNAAERGRRRSWSDLVNATRSSVTAMALTGDGAEARRQGSSSIFEASPNHDTVVMTPGAVKGEHAPTRATAREAYLQEQCRAVQREILWNDPAPPQPRACGGSETMTQAAAEVVGEAGAMAFDAFGFRPNLHRGHRLVPGLALSSSSEVAAAAAPDVLEFSDVALDRFFRRNGFSLMLRAHQQKDSGFQLGHSTRVITLFSCSNYCGELSNRAGGCIVAHGRLRLVCWRTRLRQSGDERELAMAVPSDGRRPAMWGVPEVDGDDDGFDLGGNDMIEVGDDADGADHHGHWQPTDADGSDGVTARDDDDGLSSYSTTRDDDDDSNDVRYPPTRAVASSAGQPLGSRRLHNVVEVAIGDDDVISHMMMHHEQNASSSSRHPHAASSRDDAIDTVTARGEGRGVVGVDDAPSSPTMPPRSNGALTAGSFPTLSSLTNSASGVGLSAESLLSPGPAPLRLAAASVVAPPSSQLAPKAGGFSSLRGVVAPSVASAATAASDDGEEGDAFG